MKIKLEYKNGKVEAKSLANGREYEVYEEGLSPSFRRYYQRIKSVFTEEMLSLEKEHPRGVNSKLNIELEFILTHY